jgi:hypothetical protein
VPDTDTDGDGTPDCNDNCPDDPDKTEPGICGCGVPDTDTDGDGTANCLDTDDDDDGMPDGWEIIYGFNPIDDSDADDDKDNDGLTNLEEYQNGTLPSFYDTDMDSLSDGDEVNIYGSNPNNKDTDGDGFDDGVEVNYETDPDNPDDYPPTGAISGTVYDGEGAVITGISIELKAYQSSSACSIGAPGSVTGSALSNEDTGEYTITGLPEGDYCIMATDPGHDYATEYWNGDPDDPSSWDCDEGDYVPVVADETASSVDFELGPAGIITGKVTGSDTGGGGLYFIYIQAWSEQCSGGVPVASATTDTNGDYTIYGLPLGESFYVRTFYFGFLPFTSGYNYINVWHDGETYAYHCEGVVPVAVEELTTINFELLTGETITGRVTDQQTGLGISYVGVTASTAQCDGQVVAYAAIDAEGYYTIRGLPSGESFYLGAGAFAPYVGEWYYDVGMYGCYGATAVLVGSSNIDFELDVDLDGDGIPDGWEDSHGLNPDDDSDAGIDLDNDTLTNLEEYQNGTDLNDADTDDDGLNDSDEVNTHGTNPADPDTENDGMPDGWEVTHDLDPLSDDASGDPDDDGYTNLQEYSEGGDPNDSATPFPWELFYPAFIKNK